LCEIETEIEKSAQMKLQGRLCPLSVSFSAWLIRYMFLGATAIEDKLQDGVPSTLKALLAADIKIWFVLCLVLSNVSSSLFCFLFLTGFSLEITYKLRSISAWPVICSVRAFFFNRVVGCILVFAFPEPDMEAEDRLFFFDKDVAQPEKIRQRIKVFSSFFLLFLLSCLQT
jgi:hypothetical protein